MARQVRAEIHQADRELRRFILYQFGEAKKLGYPTMSAFAREIARGTVSCPPPTEEDPLMEAVGEFYFQRLIETERRIISERYMQNGTEKQKAQRLSMSLRSMQMKTDRILERLREVLYAKGFYVRNS